MTNKENPWKLIKSEIVHSNPWNQFISDSVVNPDGSDGNYSYVKGENGSAVLAIDKEDYVYLVGQFRYPVKEYCYDVIGGNCFKEEDFKTAALRELKEETGIVANSIKELAINIAPSPWVVSEKVNLYLVTDFKFDKSNPDSTEVLSVKKIHLSELRKMINSGKMMSSLVIMALYFYDQLKLKENL